MITLHDATAEDRAADPLARSAWEHAHAHAPPRPGDEVLLGRFFVDRDAHQAPSPTLNLTTMVSTREWMRRPRLSWCYIACADAGRLRAPDGLHRLHAGRGRRRRGRRPPDRACSRATGAARAPSPGSSGWASASSAATARRRPPAAPPALALSRPAFAEAVRDALRDLHRPAALARNPLARTRVVARRGRADDPAAALRALLEEAVAAATADPRDAKLARALDRTYLRPAPTQEAAAELLGLPFSTYRGHLTRGLERVTELLWERELYGQDP